MEWLLEMGLQYPRRFAVGCLALLLAAGSLVWWQAVWQNPQHVFEDMLANNLATTSVTRHVIASDATEKIDQTVRLQMGSTNAVDWLVSATQNGAHVTTESIATPTTGYLRYIDIGNSKSEVANFGSILNQWGKSDGKTDSSLNHLFSQTLLDISNAPVPPIGNLPSAQRENLLQFIRGEKVFTPDFSKVKHEVIAGRSVWTYAVTVKLGAYVRLMQAYARDLGVHDLDEVDVTQYASAPDAVFSMSVDQFSHQLVQVAYAPSGFVQSYSDWGLQSAINIPKTSITTTELQRRLQAAGKA